MCIIVESSTLFQIYLCLYNKSFVMLYIFPKVMSHFWRWPCNYIFHHFFLRQTVAKSFFDKKKLYLKIFQNNDFNGSFNEWNQFCEWLLQCLILLTCIIWKFKTSNYLIIAYLIVWKWFVALTNVLVFSREIKCKRKYEGS